jgi:hypothetical protein
MGRFLRSLYEGSFKNEVLAFVWEVTGKHFLLSKESFLLYQTHISIQARTFVLSNKLSLFVILNVYSAYRRV